MHVVHRTARAELDKPDTLCKPPLKSTKRLEGPKPTDLAACDADATTGTVEWKAIIFTKNVGDRNTQRINSETKKVCLFVNHSYR
jgi:hypothetical protein